jgi:UDP-2-acetamido-2,6-beta-L-arabino-hexul-4-ose reductase
MDDETGKSKMAFPMKYKVKELEIHSDKRGWLVEMLKRNEIKEDIKQIYVATIKPGCIRGNHYHLKRQEWFLIIGDKAKLYLEDFKTKEKVSLLLSAKKPKVITIFPEIAHAVKNSGKETVYLVSAQNTIHNRKNPDTFPYLIKI